MNQLLFQQSLDALTSSSNNAREALALTKKNATLDRIATAANLNVSIARRKNESLTMQLEAANAALAEARATCREWQATMDAWQGLAITLRDEIKACPNEDAHHFGKNKEARNKLLCDLEDKKRIELGLKPRVRT